MILQNTLYKITDNSGAKIFKGIKIYKTTPFSKINIGKILIGAVHNIKLKENSKIKQLLKGEKKNAVLIRTKNRIFRKDGSSINFFENSVVLVDKKLKPLATRILGFLPLDLRQYKIAKILLLAEKISL